MGDSSKTQTGVVKPNQGVMRDFLAKRELSCKYLKQSPFGHANFRVFCVLSFLSAYHGYFKIMFQNVHVTIMLSIGYPTLASGH